jgi:hypothetical protein
MPWPLGDKVLEIDPGPGFTAYRLAAHVRELTLVDAACADLSQPGLARKVGTEFDIIFGLDVFECVRNPRTCLHNLASVHRSDGLAFLTYPNTPTGDGVTWFETLEPLNDMLCAAGFNHWEVFAIYLRPYASAVYTLMHEYPLRVCRWLRLQKPVGSPQIYEETWAFQRRKKVLPYKALLHFWWGILSAALNLGGELFLAEPLNGRLAGRQLVISAWK